MTRNLTASERFLPVLLAVIATFLLFPYTFYETPLTGFDPSWMIAIHMAVKNHSIFGTDFAFTYGPLAVLRFRYPIVVSKYGYLLADIFFLSMAFTVFRHFFKRHLKPGPVLFMFCCVLLCMTMELEKWYFFFLFYFLIAFIQEPDKPVYLVYAGLYSAICLYIKVNSGIVDTFFYVAVLTWCLATRKLNWKGFVLALISYYVVLQVSAWLLHTRLLEYFVGSFYLIKHYNEVMWLPLDKNFGVMAATESILVWLLFLLCAGIAGWKWFARKQFHRDLDTLFCYGIIAAGLFIWYKNGFVRADTHVIHFFEMGGVLMLFVFLVTPTYLGRKWIYGLSWAALLASCMAMNLLPASLGESNFVKLAKFKLVPEKIGQIKSYFTGLADYDQVFAGYASQTSRPNAFKDVIGEHTADVVPMELSILYYNGLRYEPRPGLQSYSIYDYFLDSLCYTKYMSPRAPDYVLFSHDAIDERFPWSDEARTKLALIDRYRVQTEIASQLILQKREQPRAVVITREDVRHVRLGEDIPVKQGQGFLLTRFFVHYSLAAKLRTLFYQPPPLRMVFTTEDGQVFACRTFVPLLADGIILNKFVSSTREFQLLLLSDGRLTPDLRSFRIEPVTPGGFQPDIEMVNTWYSFAAKTPQEAYADSVAIEKLAGGSGPHQPLPHIPVDSDISNTRFRIENFADHGNYIRVGGWAIRDNLDNTHTSIGILLVSDTAAYALSTTRVPVKEFPLELGQRKDIDSTGFTAIIARSSLPPGNYRLKAVIYDSVSGHRWSRELDKYVDIPHIYSPQRVARFAPASLHAAEIAYNIDTAGATRQSLLIKGWAFLKTAGSRMPTRIILQNDSVTYLVPTDFSRRIDIMGVYQKPWLEYSGFSMVLPRTPELIGQFTIGIEKTDPTGKNPQWVLTDRTLDLGSIRLDTPVRIQTLPATGQLYGNFDLVEEDSGIIRLAGWALNDTTAAPGPADIVFKSETSSYVCPTHRSARLDIAGRFKNADLNRCGFAAAVDKSILPKGHYRLGIRMMTTKGETGTVLFFDRFVDIK